MRYLLLGVLTYASMTSFGQEQSKFAQLGTDLPTANTYRTASGAPGHEYYQQKADYKISVRLDDSNQRIYGEEVITYTNNSPDGLDYLWIQLDQNMRNPNSMTQLSKKSSLKDGLTPKEALGFTWDFDGGFRISKVRSTSGDSLNATINNTMMRVDLPNTLKKGQKVSVKIEWWYPINDRAKIGGRSGYEYFESEDNYLYTIAQFFPRMAVYNDVEGWQHKQFLGQGEFTLPFGDYEVSLTVPSDFIVASTGELQNAGSVLTSEQRKRYEQARKSYDKPVFIVTETEAKEAEKQKKSGEKTWVFKAINVRDFAFAASRKFIWDAMGVKINGKTTMAESFYPKEGNPLWEQYSTKVVAHTLRVYSKYTIDYPYPRAISVHTNQIGMEYPMICFNGGRPNADGTYSESTKYGMISVIIHEVGHNFFPMIINSDERQWTWMDEGLNTFTQYLAEQEWDRDYPSRRGPSDKIVPYMKSPKDKMVPIMTNSESLLQFGNNAYGKPATALNILRETVMGRELFDYAFKTYAQRWAFKHPSPADFFRTMEDASAVDLDWFWRGWFYTTDAVDIALKNVKTLSSKDLDPNVYFPKQETSKNITISDIRNKSAIKTTIVESDAETRDLYNEPYAGPTEQEQAAYDNYLSNLPEAERNFITTDHYLYELSFENVGGLIMPIILEFNFTDGSSEVIRIPAEVWIKNESEFKKVFTFDKEVVNIIMDPFYETADIDRDNNYWPASKEPTQLELFRRSR